MRAATAALALALLLAGCGSPTVAGERSGGGGSGATSPSASPPLLVPTPTPTPSPTPVVVAVNLRQTTAKLRVGQVLLVRPLGGHPGRATAVVTDGSGSVLRSGGGGPTTGWRFLAVGRGVAHVAVVYAPQCVPGELCPMFRGLLAKLAVTVT